MDLNANDLIGFSPHSQKQNLEATVNLGQFLSLPLAMVSMSVSPGHLQHYQLDLAPSPHHSPCQGSLGTCRHGGYSAADCRLSFSSRFSAPLSSSSISPSSPLNLSWAHLGLVLDFRNMKRPLPRGKAPRPRPRFTHFSLPSPSRSSCCRGEKTTELADISKPCPSARERQLIHCPPMAFQLGSAPT